MCGLVRKGQTGVASTVRAQIMCVCAWCSVCLWRTCWCQKPSDKRSLVMVNCWLCSSFYQTAGPPLLFLFSWPPLSHTNLSIWPSADLWMWMDSQHCLITAFRLWLQCYEKLSWVRNVELYCLLSKLWFVVHNFLSFVIFFLFVFWTRTNHK